MSERPKMKAFTTPAGSALFCKIGEPSTKWNPDGEYEATIVLAEEEHKEFLAMLDQLADDAFDIETEDLKPAQKKKAHKVSPYTEECDADGNPTGNVKIKAKMKAKGKKKDGSLYEAEPAVFDAAKPKPKQLDRKGLIIGNGSTIKLNIQPRSYFVSGTGMCGVSLQLRAVQIIELKSYKGDASSYGFEGENDGLAPMDAGSAEDGDSDF